MQNVSRQPIGIFDSGYGGLTIFKEIVDLLPEFDYVYLGDNARTPYGNRSYDIIHEYTLQCVKKLIDIGCPLVILACNTASAKALRTIQQVELPNLFPEHKVLGVIRPTTELIGIYSKTRKVGILATKGTVGSQTYKIEINKFFPDISVYQQACPMWVPLIENNEHLGKGVDYFVEKYITELLDQCPSIDTIVLGCTHYPLLIDKIKKYLPSHISVISQGKIVADSLDDYLHRHPEIRKKLSSGAHRSYYTTDDPLEFGENAKLFLGQKIEATHIDVH